LERNNQSLAPASVASARGANTTQLDAQQVYHAASDHPSPKPSAHQVPSENPLSGSVFSSPSQSHVVSGIPSEVLDEPNKTSGINYIFSLPPFELTAIFVLLSIAPAVRNNSRNPMGKARAPHRPDEQGQTRTSTEPKGPLPSSGMTAATVPPLESGTSTVRIPPAQPRIQRPLDGPGTSASPSPAREGSARAERVERVVSVQPLPESRLMYPPPLPGTSSPPGERNVDRTRADKIGHTVSAKPTTKPLLVSRPPEDRPRVDEIKRTVSTKAATQPPPASGLPVDRPGVSTSPSPPGESERSVNRPRVGQITRTVSAKETTQPPLASRPPVDRPGVSRSSSPPREINVDTPRAIERTVSTKPTTQLPLTSGPPEDRSGTSATSSLPLANQVERTISVQPTAKPLSVPKPPKDRPGISRYPSLPGERIVDGPRANEPTVSAKPTSRLPLASGPPEGRPHANDGSPDYASGINYLIFSSPRF
jgi:hypothetical protein